jgi:NADP-dependent 3-hydroxy acid dehydrogenase YdfG
MLKKLEGKIAVITGGTEGIGLAAAKLFVREGAYVFITGRRQKELDEAVQAIGTNVSGVQGAVAKLADLDRLYETVSKVKGRIDIVFANAGVGEFVPFGAVTEEHFDKLFNINVRGTLFTVQKALPLLKDGGSIILNGSVASVKGTAAFGVYAASKAAIRSFLRTWTAPGQDAVDRVRALRSRKPKRAWRREAGDVQLPGVHPHLWANVEDRQIPRFTQNHPPASLCQVESAEGGASKTQTSVRGGAREMVEVRGTGILQLSCSSRESGQPPKFSVTGDPALDACASAPQPEESDDLAATRGYRGPLAPQT